MSQSSVETLAPEAVTGSENRKENAVNRTIAPIALVANAGSGHHRTSTRLILETLKEQWEAAGRQVFLYLPKHASHLKKAAQHAVQDMHQTGGIVVAAGGDGTINTVAQALIDKKATCPMGIIPMGTFNYVARALNIPLEPEEAGRLILNADLKAIHVGKVNQVIYLNNASIGLYPHLIEEREKDQKYLGRFRSTAWISGLLTLLSHHESLNLTLHIEGDEHTPPNDNATTYIPKRHTQLETPIVFFGNNPLQLQDMHLSLSHCAEQGKLAGVAVKPIGRFATLALLAKLQLGTFEQAPEVETFCAEKIQIRTHKARLKLAIDGEVSTLKTPLNFSVLPNAITLLVPYVTASV